MPWSQYVLTLSVIAICLLSICYGRLYKTRPQEMPKALWNIAAFYALILGLMTIIAALMVMNQDHLLMPSRWGHHGLREFILAMATAALGLLELIIAFMVFRYRRTDSAKSNLLPPLGG